MTADRTYSSIRQLSAWLRALSWPAIAAGLAVLGLSIAFQQVVSGAVRQGELRRAAVVLQSEATWRCNAITSQRARAGCLVQLSAAP